MDMKFMADHITSFTTYGNESIIMILYQMYLKFFDKALPASERKRKEL